MKATLRPLKRDALKRLHCLVTVFYTDEPPPDGAKPVEVTEEARV